MIFSCDVAVIGAGHAGIEAALAAARMGLDTVLFTLSLDAVGNMPCNPSIGGTGKGHLVFEADVLGGAMGALADSVMLQNRMLNLGKGAAVHSKRIQADRQLYRLKAKSFIENTPYLRLIQAEAAEIITEATGDTAPGAAAKRITAIRTSLGDEWRCRAAILCCGTYLNGTTHIGMLSTAAGPDGMLPASLLTASLLNEGVAMMRFKTGTPVRVHADSIDYSGLEIQYGERPVLPFSVDTDWHAMQDVAQMPCHIVYTNADTHRIIKENLDKSPLYSGKIHGTGPRYCPSIEDKVVRFADKERHQLFIEPVGGDTKEMYMQGFSTSLPADVQYQMLRSLNGFGNAQIMRYAYAIEYDCTDPTQLYPTLEFKNIAGLYGAGQFNGTSGYEEAAVQGIVAGVNAALKIKGEPPMILPRSSSYTGTLIDDLVTKGTKEPYRIMTSRSEHRLFLRQDNTDLRLLDIAEAAGAAIPERAAAYRERREAIQKETARLSTVVIHQSEIEDRVLTAAGTTPVPAGTGIRLSELMRRPQVTYENTVEIDPDRPDLLPIITDTVQTEIKYEGYVKKQQAEIARMEKLESKPLPADTDYRAIKGLRLEAAEKLDKVRPANIGQASRISGVSPADIAVLLIYFK